MNAASERQNRSLSFFACSLLIARLPLTASETRAARAEDVEQVGLAQAVLLHQGLEDFVRLHWREDWAPRLVIVNQLEQQFAQGALFRGARGASLQQRLDQTRSALQFFDVSNDAQDSLGQQIGVAAAIELEGWEKVERQIRAAIQGRRRVSYIFAGSRTRIALTCARSHKLRIVLADIQLAVIIHDPELQLLDPAVPAEYITVE